MATSALEILIKASDQASGTLKKVGNESGALGDKLKGLAVAAGAAVVAFAGFKALEGAIGATQGLAAAISKIKREAGLTEEEASKLIFAFKHYGLSSDDASRSLGILAKKLKGVQDEETGVATGGKSTAAILADLGIKSVDAAGNLAPMGTIMPQIADVFKAMPDGISKTGLAMQLFGRSGKDMIPVLNQGSEGLKALGLDAEKLGVVMDEKAVVAAKNLTFAQRDLGEAFKGLQISVGTAIIPAMTALTLEFTNGVVAVRKYVEEGLDRAGPLLAKFGDVLQNVTDFLKQNEDAHIALAGAVGILLVAALGVATVAAWNFAVAMLATGVPEVIIGIAALGAAIALLITHWDDVTKAIGRARDWFLNLPAPVKAVAIALNLPIVALVALGVGINQLVTHWDSAWLAIRKATEAAVNPVIGGLNILLKGVETAINTVFDIYNALPSWMRGDKIKHITLQIDPIDLTPVYKAISAFDLLGSLMRQVGARQVEAANDAALLQNRFNNAVPAINEVAAGTYEVAAGAGGAAKGLDAAAKAALEAHKAFVTLIGTTTLYNAMAAEASVTEITLTEAMSGVARVGADRKAILEAEIGILQKNLDAIKGTGDANDILRDSIQGTIDRLQEQIDAVDAAKNKWVLFGADGIGPVTAAINAMNDAISEQVGGIQGLLSVQTQEEAGLIARIANYNAQIAGLEAVTSATQALTQAEQDRLNLAQSRSAGGGAEIEKLEDYMAIIDEMERRKKERNLTPEEQQQIADALRHINLLEHQQWTMKNVHEKVQERIWDLRQEGEASDETVSSLEALAKKRTAEGDAAVKVLEAQRDPLQKQLDAIQKTKDAEEKGLEARAKGFPTMEQWTKFLVGEGLEHGLITDAIQLKEIPALRGWASTHGQTVFDIAKGLQLLEIAQDTFLVDTTTMLNDWTTQWAEAAGQVAAAMASVGAEPTTPAGGVPALQSGGYIRRGGLALLHAGELVTPARSVRGAGAGATTTINNIHVGEQGVFLGDAYQQRKLAEWFKAQGFLRRQDLS